MADIFLSYAKEDQARAKILANLLASCGWSVFWDVNIKAAADWRAVLQSELDAAGAVVVLWSQSSVASTWVQEEAERGRARLISVRVDDVALPLGFSRQQAIDLVGWRGGRVDGIDKLVEGVSETVRKPPQRRPKIPRSPAQKLRLGAAAAVVASIVAAYAVVNWPRQPAPIMNQEILIDSSAGMSDRFGGGPTKLQAAIEALRTRNLHPAENLALRSFGGECHADDASRVLVSFGTGRRDRIMSAASGLRASGRPTLADGVISALADMQPLPHTKRLIVITGHADACQEEAVRDIKERVDAYKKEGQDIALEFRFIALAVPAKDQARIRALSGAAGGTAYFVETVEQLNDVLQYVLEFEPALLHVRTVWDVVGKVGDSMNEVANNINQREFDEAEKILEAGHSSFRNLTPSFTALAGHKLSVEFERFYTLASQNRSLQEQVLAIGRTIIQQGRASGEAQSPEMRESISRWNEVIAKYNGNANEMNRLTDAIVKQARRRG